MSSDPEKPIEKLLRASAKQRRDQAGDSWDLHPANRRLLQREVAKKFGHPTGRKTGSALSWLSGLSWVKSFGAVAVVAMVVAVAWWSLPRSAPSGKMTELARNEPARVGSQLQDRRGEKVAQTDSNQLVDNEARNTLLVSDNGAAKKAEIETLTAASHSKDNIALAPPAVAQTSVQLGLQPSGAPDAKMPGPAEPLAVNAPRSDAATSFAAALSSTSGAAPAASPVPQGLGLAPENLAGLDKTKSISSERAARLPLSQSAEEPFALDAAKPIAGRALSNTSPVVPYGYFAAVLEPARQVRGPQQNTQPRSALSASAVSETAKKSAGAVLSYFRLEQTGSELHVFDSDGSLYSGPIQTVTGPSRDQAAEAEATGSVRSFRARSTDAPVVPSLKGQASPSNASDAYTFQVVGTNQTSRQKVVFTGRLFGATNLGSQSAGVVTMGGAAGGPVQRNGTISVPAIYQVSGTARVGASQLLNINAKTAPGSSPAVPVGK